MLTFSPFFGPRSGYTHIISDYVLLSVTFLCCHYYCIIGVGYVFLGLGNLTSRVKHPDLFVNDAWTCMQYVHFMEGESLKKK